MIDPSRPAGGSSVVIPTIGRTSMLLRCVRSVLACIPPPDEIVVSDQSVGTEVSEAIGGIDAGVRVVPSTGRGIAKATNDGIKAARCDSVLVTHDDCTVRTDWVATASALRHQYPAALLTGRVLAPARGAYVPSTIDDHEPREYTGRRTSGVLFPANMVFGRAVMLAFGGFDERPGLRLAGEDNDLCYRWLRDGRPMRYEPSLTVWHHDWRSPAQMRATHVVYAKGQGAFYAKHLRGGDVGVLPLLRWDLAHAAATTVHGLVFRTPRWQQPYREMLWPMVGSLARELWRTRREGSSR